MNLLGFSQDGFPRKIVYNGDTLVLITTDQLKMANLTYVEKTEYKELLDSMQILYNQKSLAVLTLNEMVESLNRSILLKDKTIASQDSIIDNYKIITKDLKLDVKKTKFQLFWRKAGFNLLYVPIGGLLVTTGYFAYKSASK